jgi:hypothetical protein
MEGILVCIVDCDAAKRGCCIGFSTHGKIFFWFIVSFKKIHDTYDHRLEKIGHPVRSAVLKLQIGRLVVGWVTTSEYLLLYVFAFCFCQTTTRFADWCGLSKLGRDPLKHYRQFAALVYLIRDAISFRACQPSAIATLHTEKFIAFVV